ncbi:MAG: hypothetical protein ACRDSN_23040 [Pseudonocardiaceae bacterium]
MRNLVLAVLIGAVPAIVIVACGGDDDAPIVAVPTTTAPADQLSKDEFIDETDGVCAEANAAIANLAETSAGDPSTAIADEREILEGELDQIDSLGAPSEDETTLNDFIDALESLLDTLGKQELAAERDDTTALAELETEEATARTELTTAAEEYGFRDCGQEGAATIEGGDTGAATRVLLGDWRAVRRAQRRLLTEEEGGG